MKAKVSITGRLATCVPAALGLLVASGAAAHDTVTFDRDIKPIIQRTCGGATCHVNRRESGVDLTSHQSTIESVGTQYRGPIVIPGDPDASPLMDKINSQRPRFGARMPRGQTPLTDIEINLFRRWIREGALNRHIPQHGDANNDDDLDVTDAVFILSFLFQRGEAPDCLALADANRDGAVNVSDAVFLLVHLFVGGKAPAELTAAEEESCEKAQELTFESIYTKVFRASCAFSSCHASEGGKGGLSLGTIDEAYEQLVGVEPQNEAARAQGLLRVDAGKPDNSFLLRKLGQPGPGEGSRMPASSAEPLPADVVNAIREWILAGAPRTESVPGVPDIGEIPPPTLGELTPPPVPENGVQLHLPPFSVAPRTEREIFFFAERPFADVGTDEIFVERIDIHMLDSSHHFIIYEWLGRTNPGPGLRPLPGVVDILNSRRFVVGSQQSFFTLAFPEGVGLRFTKDTNFDLNSHYLNLNGTETLRAEVYINFFFAEPGEITTVVKPIFEINPVINVPPNQTRTTEWRFPGPVGIQLDPALGALGRVTRETHIYTLSSHMHRHGVRFSAFHTRNGRDFDPPARIYDNFDWDDPVYTVYDPPFVLSPGDGIRFTTTHTYHDPPSPNAPPLTFDITSEDEMAILLGYYAIP